MFKPYGMYRHELMRDVGFEVVKSFYVKEKKLYKLKVSWWNIGNCHDGWPMQITQSIEILEDDLPRYKKISPSFRTPIEEYAPVYY